MVFTDKAAIITGGSKGIGSGCARVFVDAGAKVTICGRNAERGEAIASELNEMGPGRCVFDVCDVSEPEQVRGMIDGAVDRFGFLDCLINNAGYHPPVQTIEKFTLEDLEDVWRTNFVSQFVACRHALPHLRKRGGSIINMGSLVSQIGQEGATTYCATKGAISSFTKALAIDEACNGVRVNAVLPGNVVTGSRTDFVASSPDGPALDRWIDSTQHPGRSGTSEETGQLCLFLASDSASFITGIDVIISGGAELGYGVKFPAKFI